jgi:hypothetical protein
MGGRRILCGEIIVFYCEQHINTLHGQNVWLNVVQRVVYLHSSFKNSSNSLAQFKEIRWYNLPEVLMRIKKFVVIHIVVVGILSEGKIPPKWRINSFISITRMLQDTGWVSIKYFLANNNMTTLEHPPHSPQLAAADFYLFV